MFQTPIQPNPYTTKSPHPCPTCGRCPTCGHTHYPNYPRYQPWLNKQPQWGVQGAYLRNVDQDEGMKCADV